jgi:hypothetical protein
MPKDKQALQDYVFDELAAGYRSKLDYGPC